MNETQRYNLQKGVPEDRRREGTTYESDGSFLDNYLLEKRRIYNELIDKEEVMKRIEIIAASKIEAKLEDLFKGFK